MTRFVIISTLLSAVLIASTQGALTCSGSFKKVQYANGKEGCMKTADSFIACPGKYEDLFSVNGCYRYVETRKSHMAAKWDCRNDKGDLLNINSQAELTKVLKVMKGYKLELDDYGYFWTGAHKESNGKWTSGGNPAEPMKFNNWMKNKPADKRNKCVLMVYPYGIDGKLGGWTDASCSSRYRFPYICQAEAKKPVEKMACPPGYYRNGYGCFKFVRKWLSNAAARKACRKDHAYSDLVYLDSQAKEMMIKKLIEDNKLPQVDYWTGAVQNRKSGKWSWGSGGKVMTYENWMEPADKLGKDGNCAITYPGDHPYVFDRVGAWRDAHCGARFNFICEASFVKVLE